MFLLPALVAAGAYEIGEAIRSTENKKTVDLPVPPRLPKRIPTRITVDPQQPTLPVDDSMSDKQLVVFGTEKHPGINIAQGEVGNQVWSTAVSQSQLQGAAEHLTKLPLAYSACKLAVQSALPSFTPDWVVTVGTDLCFTALRELARAAIPITQKSVVKQVLNLWENMKDKAKKMFPRSKATKAAKAVANKAASTSKQRVSGFIAPVNAPAVMSSVVGRGGNAKTRSTQRGITITHSEMIGTVVTNSTALFYSVAGYAINPGKGDVFPWLSSMAVNYDKYRLRRMVVHVVSMQPTSTAGRMGIGYDPDSTDDLPADRGEVFAMYKHVEGPVWQNMSLELPVTGVEKYCNTHTSNDSKLIDEGQFIIFSDKVPAPGSASIADIIVEYTIDLLDPQQALFATSYNYLGGISATGGTSFNPLRATGPKYASFFTNSSTSYYMVPSPGYYMIEVFANDAGGASPVIAIHNGTVNNMYGTKFNSTTVAVARVLVKVSTNTVNPTLGTFVGDYLGVTLSGVANLAALESHRVTITRVAPPQWTTFDATGYTTTAAGADL